MSNIEIQRVHISQINELRDISVRTFFETFSEQNSASDMQKYLENNLSIEQLTLELQDENSEFYFSILDNEVIGYLKINHGQAQTELKDQASLEIERIYVLKEFLGKGVGQVLYNRAINIAKQENINYVWLGVWEHNPRAIAFYKKNGFLEFDKHVFKLGDDEQTDIMMRLRIVRE
ncbi:MAG: GNAT family N-acetyltransferase [Crocinitomicaceae bacterium]